MKCFLIIIIQLINKKMVCHSIIHRFLQLSIAFLSTSFGYFSYSQQPSGSRPKVRDPKGTAAGKDILTKMPKYINYDKLPIKAERTISFSTEEASYIDIDISSDGNTLLCSFLGDLFTIPAKGG